jgi:hypothetical protein
MPSSAVTARGIPRSLAPFFQEYDLDDLDPDRAAATVIERTLRYGNRAELRWLFTRYPEATIATSDDRRLGAALGALWAAGTAPGFLALVPGPGGRRVTGLHWEMVTPPAIDEEEK